jgi:peptidoglycan-associated lipoprotein
MYTKKTIPALLALCITSLLILGSGCGKKTIDPPLVGEGSSLSGGTNIDYPAADKSGYDESTLKAEGTLDDTGGGAKGSLAAETVGSEEYKREHGRSSVGLSPIYFDFDQAGVRPDMADRMNSNADFLKQVPGSTVIVEGNCDDRGTNEYNLALGQRRALNSQDYLINLGIEANRIRTISYGEERLLFMGQDEESHALNRRNDFVLE